MFPEVVRSLVSSVAESAFGQVAIWEWVYLQVHRLLMRAMRCTVVYICSVYGMWRI